MQQTDKAWLWYLWGSIILLCFTGFWLILDVHPVWAQDQTVNYTLADLRCKDSGRGLDREPFSSSLAV